MNDKEFVLVSQGIEIMRTKSQEQAINYVKKENDDWFDYKQKCIDNYESYANNYINLEIEYSKDKDLQTRWNSLREWLNKGLEEPIYIQGDIFWCSACRDVLDKMNELEGKDK